MAEAHEARLTAAGNEMSASFLAAKKRSDETLAKLEENPGKFTMLTGDRPTGRLHLGHFFGSIKERVAMQNRGVNTNIIIADYQVITDRDTTEHIDDNVLNLVIDYMAAGIDPERTMIFTHSAVPALNQLMLPFLSLCTEAELQRNPTVKTEVQMRGFPGESIPVGFFTYPISQAADITLFKATTVPAGQDQEPMLEQSREIVRRFNNIYGETLVEPNIMLPSNSACLRLPGTDGKAKMSKSLGNCIYLSDTAKELKKKVNSMYTDPEHIHIDQPGHLEGNTVFTYLDAFCTDEDFQKYLPEYQNLDELKAHYTRGGLGDGTCKKFLYNVLNDRLTPIRERRLELQKDIPAIYEMLRKGCEKARQAAIETMDEVRKAMKITYFDDEELIKEQAKRYAEGK